MWSNPVQRVIFSAGLLWGIPCAAPAAQWRVVVLTPDGVDGARGLSAAGNFQAGSVFPQGGPQRAAIWSGSPASWIDLHPASGATASWVSATDGQQQAGLATFFGTTENAGVWSGSSATWINLNPTGASRSWANGVGAGQQVGVAVFNGIEHAGLWHGSPASWVDLHPSVRLHHPHSRPTGLTRSAMCDPESSPDTRASGMGQPRQPYRSILGWPRIPGSRAWAVVCRSAGLWSTTFSARAFGAERPGRGSICTPRAISMHQLRTPPMARTKSDGWGLTRASGPDRHRPGSTSMSSCPIRPTGKAAQQAWLQTDRP